MTVLTALAILVVALLHAFFLALEMFLWTKPAGRRVFGLTPEFAEASKTSRWHWCSLPTSESPKA